MSVIIFQMILTSLPAQCPRALQCTVDSRPMMMLSLSSQIDVRGRELSRGAFEFSNTSEGFENAKAWVLALAAKHDKKQIVLGLEPTGHYWFALAAWMISNGISVVQVNPYAVKQSKEIEDNSQLKQ